jgi:peptide/nickel transport system ATP-binding protein
VTLLKVDNLSVAFSTPQVVFRAVKSVSFELKKGEILAIIGESGSGKSVLCQSLTRLIPNGKITGEATLSINSEDNISLVSCHEELLRTIRQKQISYIFQEPMTALNPLMRCGDQIIENATQKNNEYLSSLLHKVELFETERVAKSYPHQLSGGQRQRVMIAMAIAAQPKLIIADEPTTALDAKTQLEIQQLLKKLVSEDGVSVLFITHDLKSLTNFANQIGVLYQGQLVEIGTANEILTKPSHPYTKALLKSRPSYESKGYTLPEVKDFLTEENSFIPQKIKHKTLDETVISLRNIKFGHFKKKWFSQSYTQVINDVSFEINRGDILGIIGESGSGKSTLANILLHIWQPQKGEINLIKSKDTPISDFIQMVFQDPYSSLNPKHQIGTALIESLRATTAISYKNAKKKAIELIKEVGLSSSDFYKFPSEFSGGQRQRICIAKALIKNPKVLVLDEAVAALDVSIQAKILNLLHDLKSRYQLTYILISHDMNVVTYFCNKLVILEKGKIVEMGDTNELIRNAANELTQKLLIER